MYTLTRLLKDILKSQYIFLILLSNNFLILSILLFSKSQLKKLEDMEFKDLSERIENCIDIEKKNRRTLKENIILSEYCMDKFGGF